MEKYTQKMKVKYLSQYNPTDLEQLVNSFIEDKEVLDITFIEKDHWFGAFVKYSVNDVEHCYC